MLYAKPTKRQRRPSREPVTSEQVAFVKARDGMCFMFRIDIEHQCRDAMGNPHSPYALDKMSIEHVKRDHMMGRRGKLLLLLCRGANVAVPSQEVRDAMREYLAKVPQPPR